MKNQPLLIKLANSSICKGLTEAEIITLFDIASQVRIAAGGTIMKEGELADALLVIVDGQAEVLHQGKRLAILDVGQVLGELTLFGNHSHRTATAKAMSEVTLLRVPTPPFRKLLAAFNLAALKVVNNVAHQMADRLLAANSKLIDRYL